MTRQSGVIDGHHLGHVTTQVHQRLCASSRSSPSSPVAAGREPSALTASRFQHTSSPPRRSSGRPSSTTSDRVPTARTVTTSQDSRRASAASCSARAVTASTMVGLARPAWRIHGDARHHRQEPCLLGHRVQECQASRGQRKGQRQAGVAPAAAQVQDRRRQVAPDRGVPAPRSANPTTCSRATAVRRPDGRQVDVLVPGQEQACLRIDGSPGGIGQGDIEGGQSTGQRWPRTPSPSSGRPDSIRGQRCALPIGHGGLGPRVDHPRRVRVGSDERVPSAVVVTDGAPGSRHSRRRVKAHQRRFGLVPPTRYVTPVSRRPEGAAVPILGRILDPGRARGVQAPQSPRCHRPRRRGLSTNTRPDGVIRG